MPPFLRQDPDEPRVLHLDINHPDFEDDSDAEFDELILLPNPPDRDPFEVLEEFLRYLRQIPRPGYYDVLAAVNNNFIVDRIFRNHDLRHFVLDHLDENDFPYLFFSQFMEMIERQNRDPYEGFLDFLDLIEGNSDYENGFDHPVDCDFGKDQLAQDFDKDRNQLDEVSYPLDEDIDE
ncbi:hypothetical protein L596_001746 [Steinernema carpocapsae]|uniref:Uncharacterized protein n=1 Tax=Steinernema carpocapsae TaxID=34508 RepID=A0A4U8UM47_STECR|nr:hypothetical protein L596_001746 [Steinernema carpocapsae]